MLRIETNSKVFFTNREWSFENSTLFLKFCCRELFYAYDNNNSIEGYNKTYNKSNPNFVTYKNAEWNIYKAFETYFTLISSTYHSWTSTASLSSYLCFFIAIGCLLFIHFVSRITSFLFSMQRNIASQWFIYIYTHTQWTMVALHNSRNVGRKTYIISNDKCAIFFSTFLSTWSRCNTRPAVPLQSCIDDRLDYTVIYIYISFFFPFSTK